jgi:hypothetical protein
MQTENGGKRRVGSKMCDQTQSYRTPTKKYTCRRGRMPLQINSKVHGRTPPSYQHRAGWSRPADFERHSPTFSPAEG